MFKKRFIREMMEDGYSMEDALQAYRDFISDRDMYSERPVHEYDDFEITLSIKYYEDESY